MCGLKGSRVEAELGEEICEAGKGWVGFGGGTGGDSSDKG